MTNALDAFREQRVAAGQVYAVVRETAALMSELQTQATALSRMANCRDSERMKIAARFLQDFFRYHRDLRRLEKMNETIDSVNLIGKEKMRELSALDPHVAPVDGRTTADLLLYAGGLARLLRYYTETNAPKGDWREFIESDITTVAARVGAYDGAAAQAEFQKLRDKASAASVGASFRVRRPNFASYSASRRRVLMMFSCACAATISFRIFSSESMMAC